MSYSPLQLAEAFIKAGELDDALDALNQHLNENPTDEQRLRLRAEVLLRLATDEHLKLAANDLRVIKNRETSDYFMLAVILERQLKTDEAESVLEQGCEQSPEDQRLRERLLQHYLTHQKFQAAEQLIAPMLISHPQDWRWRQWAGDVASKSSLYEEAIIHYEKAIMLLSDTYQLESDSPARVMHSAQNDAAALTVTGSYARLHVAIAEVFDVSNRLQEADEWYTKAEILLPDDPVIPFMRGIIAAKQSRLTDAVNFCEPTLKRMPESLKQSMTNLLNTNPDLTPLLDALQ